MPVDVGNAPASSNGTAAASDEDAMPAVEVGAAIPAADIWASSDVTRIELG